MVGTTTLGPVERIPLSGLQFDSRVWPRQHRDAERVAMFASKYQEGGENALPPLWAVRLDDEITCYDGWHRAAGAHQAGLAALPVVIVTLHGDADPIASAFILAVRASTGGHKELNRAERQAGIRRLIEESDLTDTEIADIFGVSRQTVWRQRQPRVADETRDQDPGDRYLALSTAQEVAERFFRGMEKVYEARGLGLWDSLTHDHTGERLARVLFETYGDDALERAEDFRDWCDAAISELLAKRRS